MSNSRFSPPMSASAFPFSLSPSIFSVYLTVNFISFTSRSAENVSSPSLNCTSLSFDSCLSWYVIIPVSLPASFLRSRVDSRFCPPISYSHFHVPTGSAFWSPAPARPQSPSTNATERIGFMVAPAKGGAEAVRRGPPPAADGDCRDNVVARQDRAGDLRKRSYQSGSGGHAEHRRGPSHPGDDLLLAGILDQEAAAAEVPAVRRVSAAALAAKSGRLCGWAIKLQALGGQTDFAGLPEMLCQLRFELCHDAHDSTRRQRPQFHFDPVDDLPAQDQLIGCVGVVDAEKATGIRPRSIQIAEAGGGLQ